MNSSIELSFSCTNLMHTLIIPGIPNGIDFPQTPGSLGGTLSSEIQFLSFKNSWAFDYTPRNQIGPIPALSAGESPAGPDGHPPAAPLLEHLVGEGLQGLGGVREDLRVE
ncbi:hypothetical protein, partial [Streptomyces sp. NPDC094049]|uniref:hypothetical protein n=1 Tax=Streptomyces sp. NPDC094049 TaxID=3154987 RepID=UPI003327BA27